jgi:hypothetical protein
VKRVIVFANAILLAGAGIEAPRVGCMVERSGAQRIVYGIAGNFVLGDRDHRCEVQPAGGDPHWTTVNEHGRWWLLRLDRESGGEPARIPLDRGVRFAIPFGDGEAVTAAGSVVEFRGRRWELPAAVEGLHSMGAEWIQTVTAEGSWALRPLSGDVTAYLLPEGSGQ